MVVNIDRLREALKESKVTQATAAAAMGMDEATFYRRLNRQGSTFTVEEIGKLSELLKLSSQTMQDIFFDR